MLYFWSVAICFDSCRNFLFRPSSLWGLVYWIFSIWHLERRENDLLVNLFLLKMYYKTDLLSPLLSLLRFKDSWFLLLSLPLIWKGQSSRRLERCIGSTQEGLGLPASLPVDPNRGSFQGSSWQFHTRNTKLRKFTRWHTSTEPKLQAIFSYLSLLFHFWQMFMGKTISFQWESRTLSINEDFWGSYREKLLLDHFNWCCHSQERVQSF